MNPHFSYLDERQPAARHLVRRRGDGAESHARRRRTWASRHSLCGDLGSEDRSLVASMGHARGSGAADKLRDVPPGAEVDMEGQGEILRIEDKPAHGTRDLTIDADSKMITDEVFQNLPEPYRVGRYGYSPNKVAITFDDGPDPEWTPKILDVLKQKNATATFFLIGIQTDKFSGHGEANLSGRQYASGITPSRTPT